MRLRMIAIHKISPAPKYGGQTVKIPLIKHKYLFAQVDVYEKFWCDKQVWPNFELSNFRQIPNYIDAL